MNLLSSRITSFVFLSSLFFSTASSALGFDDRENRAVYIGSLQGDVRLSRGDGKHPDLNKPWEQALPGEFVEQGFALATGQGRAEIEFEDGSAAYLAENSLLLFRDLSVRAPGDIDSENDPVMYFLLKVLFSRGGRFVSRMTLAAGTATFALQPASHDYFFIGTPTDTLYLTAPDKFFARVDAYLDATAITPQGEGGERVTRPDLPKLQIARGQTLFLQGGEIIERPGPDPAHRAGNASESVSSRLRQMEAGAGAFGALGFFPLIPAGLVLQSQPNSQPPQKPVSSPVESAQLQPPGAGSSQVANHEAWDSWVSTRVEQKSAVMTAALKASGLSSPIPGLANLYEHGTFFPCEPYGTCWEATEPDAPQNDTEQSGAPVAQSSAPSQTNVPFQPQTLQWEEWSPGWCSPPTLTTVTKVAHTPEEFRKFLRRKEVAQKSRPPAGFYDTSCYETQSYWISHRGHFARVVTPQVPPKCVGNKCKPVHPPRPLWVRAGKTVGFVPRHPNDVKGKPPINLKNGIIVPPSKPGQPVERIAWGPSQKVKVLDKVPHEFQREPAARALQVSAPEIHAHLLQEATGDKSLSVSAHAIPQITYDYKSHHFVMAGSTVSGAKSKEVAVGGIDSHGKVASFADGRSGRYAESFARSETASTYRGGSFNQSHLSGSAYSGGGHNSGYSSGSYSSGSHSSGSSSSGSYSSHSSSSGASAGSVSSSSSASSSSSGGGSRGRP